MTDDELEQRLRAHYRAIDPGRAPSRLDVRIGDALERRPSRPAFIARTRPAFAAALAAVVIVAVGLSLGLRPGGFLASPGASPTPTALPQPSTASPEPSSSPGLPTAAAAVDLAGTFRGGGLWAIQGSTLLVSSDAGASWGRSSIPVTAGSVVAAFVLDPVHAWAVTPGPGSTGSTGASTDVLRLVVHRTADGGRTWQESTIPGTYANTAQVLVFVDAQHGYLLCSARRSSDGVSTILPTDDGGASWSVAGTADWLGSMFSASDASTLWTGAEQEAGPVAHPILDVSRDGGRTWQDARLPGLEGQSGGGTHWLVGPPIFVDAAAGFVAVVSTDSNGNPETRMYDTTDAGRSWSVVADRPVEASAGPAVLDTAHWLLPVDNPFGLLATADGGASWQELTASGLSNGSWIVWIGAVDAGHAAALVPTGPSYQGPAALYLSPDGGTTWRPADLGGSAGPAPSPSASPSPSETPSLPLPSGSVPPVSGAPWSTLHLQPVEGGPVSASSVVAWSGGYLALGSTTSATVPLPAWVSRDGRSWVQLRADTFGLASLALAAPCADGVLVAVQSPTGQTTVWRSTDGVTWTTGLSPQIRVARDSDLAGSSSGAVGILPGSPYRVAFSGDGITWEIMSLPGSSAFKVQGVAAFGTGFVAVGDAGMTTGSPVAWWSADGRHWTRAAVQAHPGDGFVNVHAASGGLVAFSSTGGAPGLTSFWTSPDGRSWTVSTADPLGVLGEGEGMGNAAGIFSGDGTRLLAYAVRAAGQPTEYWVSFDGTHWTKLALTGDTAAALAGQVTPFLLRDGVLFSGDQGSWFGAGVK